MLNQEFRGIKDVHEVQSQITATYDTKRKKIKPNEGKIA